MLDQLHIRPARLEDAKSVAAIAESTFRDTFAADSAAEDMEAYARDSFGIARMEAELSDSANSFLLALAGSSHLPIGYAKLRSSTSEPSVTGPDPIELERLYVEQSAIGQGIGAALMRASLDAARDLGYRTVWLGVWENNTSAIAFYERWAFKKVGTHIFRLGSDDQTDWIMTRSVPKAI